MTVPDADPGVRQLLGAGLLAGVLVGMAAIPVSWGRLFLTNRVAAGVGEVVLGIVTGAALTTAALVPFLLAVPIVVAGPSRRAVAGGAVLVYGLDILSTVGLAFLDGFPAGVELTVLAVPLPEVARFLAVAAAVWLAYHGGYERLVAAAGNPDQHPLFAIVADRRIGPALPLQRALVAAALAALVGAGGLVVAGGVADLLRTVTRPGLSGAAPIVFSRVELWNVGIPPARLPVQLLFEASFLLAVLFVTGPRVGLEGLAKGVAAVFGVQSTVLLLPALVPPFRPVFIWDSPGPILTPLGDALLFLGVAVAVWLAVHDGLGTLTNPIRSGPAPE